MRLKRFVLLFFLSLLIGCSANEDHIKWFATKEEAIQHGLKEEGLSAGNLLGKIQSDGELFVFFKRKMKDGEAAGIVHLRESNGKYAWYKSNAEVQVKYKNRKKAPHVSFELKTYSDKAYKAYFGSADSADMAISTDYGPEVTPEIDKESQIYFYIVPMNNY
ncbi:hypothetical protein GJU41_24315 [Bacillus idriensis]|uniref:Lipoprotein n=1 Tax=Metabacillus idriensis TaxID=324768 RepID=A0A6I2MMM7_9BACI|nr:hypothetical protein [Metabacillus idriensis]MRX57063.1 hypothetical protein [Metabacillus idriensis]